MKTLTVYRQDIQALRGIAVLAVIAYHADDRYFPMGFLGVDVFFVISGFVVTPLIARIMRESISKSQRKSDLRDFYSRRIFRLIPALIITLIISYIAIFFLGPISDHQKFAKQGVATLLLLGNFGAYKDNTDYFLPNSNPLLHTWSLSVEEQIYLFLPLVTYFVFKKRIFKKKLMLLLIIGLSVLSLITNLLSSELQIVYNAIGINSGSQFSFYSPLDRFWQFGLGGALSLIKSPRLKENSSVTLILTTTISLILLILLFLPFEFSSKTSSIAITLIALIVIANESLMLLPTRVGHSLKWLGDRSYSLYLVHMPILYLAKYSEQLDWGTNGDRRLQSLLGVAFIFFLGNLMFVHVEMPFRKDKFGHSKIELNLGKMLLAILSSLLAFLSLFVIPTHEIFRDKNLPKIDTDLSREFASLCNSTDSNEFVPCLYFVNNSEKNFLLIGDSHARTFTKTIIDIGHLNQASVYTSTLEGCPFDLGLDLLDLKFSFPKVTKECIQHNQRIIDFLKDVKVDIVFYTQRSSSGYVIPLTASNTNLLVSRVTESLVQLGELTSKVIFIGITPEYSSINTVVSKLIGREGKFLEGINVENRVWKKKLLRQNIEYIDIYSLFCTEEDGCKNRLRNTWLFVDNDHLSKAGVELIKPFILGKLAEAREFSK